MPFIHSENGLSSSSSLTPIFFLIIIPLEERVFWETLPIIGYLPPWLIPLDQGAFRNPANSRLYRNTVDMMAPPSIP